MSRKNSGHDSLKHCNGNLLCVIDIETTGAVAGVHDIIQAAFLPLDSALEPLKGVTPFNVTLKPLRPENIDYRAMKVNRLEYLDLMQYALDPDNAAYLFTDWVAKLNLPLGKKLMPLWSNGNFDREFLLHWLGPEFYNDCIHYHERDTQYLALAYCDRFALHAEPLPFNRIGLTSLAGVFGIENERPHDAMFDCITTAKVYKAMLQMMVPNTPGHRFTHV